MINAMPSNPPQRILKYAVQMRKHPTSSEKKFMSILTELYSGWFAFDLKRDVDLGFEFQSIYHSNATGEYYILDFFLPKIRLAFEIDGISHLFKKQIHYDKKRTYILNQSGIKVCRFDYQSLGKYNIHKIVLNIVKQRLKALEMGKCTPKKKVVIDKASQYCNTETIEGYLARGGKIKHYLCPRDLHANPKPY